MEAAATAVTPPSLREQGNALFKEKNYLITAAVYTQAIKADPENAAVYSASTVSDKQLEKVNGSKSTTASEEQQLDVARTFQNSLPVVGIDEVVCS
ncbi:unnamed protein product [Sphagnum jensenii]|uniref:Uncharacterized protein n=1 Tax=Sphagnum jensenii TaxID=128206 RepID=A0ABP1BZ10_9BRYO